MPSSKDPSVPPVARALCVILIILTALPSLPVVEAQPNATPALFKKGKLVLIRPGAGTVTLQVEVADHPDARARGLMHRTTLAENAGMLFVFDEDQRLAFWMKNTLIPLSIAFIDRQWRINDIQDMAVAADPREGPFAIHQSAQPARYALEVRQGFFRRKGIGRGVRVQFTLYE